MADMYAGYQGPVINDDKLGQVHWNAVDQVYEKRNVTNAEGRYYNNLDGSDGGFWLPKNWFNDGYNLKTGKLNSGSYWPLIAGLAVIALILYLIFRK